MTAYNPFADELRKSLAKNPDLPAPYGTGALEPPDEVDDDDSEYWADMAADAKAMREEGN